MPFDLYQNRESKEKGKPRGKSNPFFLIPGISGNSIELLELAASLQRLNPDSDIYIHHDPRLLTSRAVEPKSIDESSRTVNNDIESKLASYPPGTRHGRIGFSLGGVIVARSAQQSRNPGSVCIIDSVTPGLSQLHFSRSGNKAATLDLISMIRLAAKLSGLPETNPEINDDHITAWSKLEYDRQLDTIYDHFVSHQCKKSLLPEKAAHFLGYYQIICCNLNSLLTCNIEMIPTLNQLQVFTTEETRRKFGCDSDAGWSFLAKNGISTVPLRGTHESSLGDELLARKITEFLKAQDELHNALMQTKAVMAAKFQFKRANAAKPISLSASPAASEASSDSSPGSPPYSDASGSPKTPSSPRVSFSESESKSGGVSDSDSISDMDLTATCDPIPIPSRKNPSPSLPSLAGHFGSYNPQSIDIGHQSQSMHNPFSIQREKQIVKSFSFNF